MDLATFYDRFCQDWEHVEIKLKDASANVYRLNMELVAEKYFDDGIYVSLTIYSSGTLHIFFTFDKIQRTLDNYELINEFNDGNSWFKAYITRINDNDFLELKYTNCCADSVDDAIDQTQHAFDQLLDEGVLKLLKPLTDITIK